MCSTFDDEIKDNFMTIVYLAIGDHEKKSLKALNDDKVIMFM